MPSRTTTAVMEALANASLEIPSIEAFGDLDLEAQARTLGEFTELLDLAEQRIIELQEKAAQLRSKAASKMERNGVASISIDQVNRLVLVEDFDVRPRISDLLPEGVSEDDPRYENTVANIREAGRKRMVETLIASPTLSDLVHIDSIYDHAQLTEILCGDEAKTDAAGMPIVPDFLKGVVEIRREIDVTIAGGGN